jgi:hypothetical protein
MSATSRLPEPKRRSGLEGAESGETAASGPGIAMLEIPKKHKIL